MTICYLSKPNGQIPKDFHHIDSSYPGVSSILVARTCHTRNRPDAVTMPICEALIYRLLIDPSLVLLHLIRFFFVVFRLFR